MNRLWKTAAERLLVRVHGLTDQEFFWGPVEGCWTVHLDAGAPDRWTIDYEWPAPVPAPFTTIAWRMIHLANGNTIYLEHAFGPGLRTFADLEPPHTASTAIEYLGSSFDGVAGWLQRATDADLDELRPSHLGSPRSAGEVMCTLIDELIHHGGEIGVLRDLYRRRANGAEVADLRTCPTT